MYTLLHISDSDKHFSSAIAEYSKRLGKQLTFDTLKPFKDGNCELVIQKETAAIIATIQKKYPSFLKIFLIKEEKHLHNTKTCTTGLTTEELHKLIQHQNCVFIIGGPYGVDREMLKKTFPEIKELSFGAITMPHGLAKLVLMEQLYRCSTLDSGKKYHY